MALRQQKARRPAGAVALLGVLSLCACAALSAGEQATGADRTDVGGDVELFSWWTSGGELDALRALLSVHEDRVDGSHVSNSATLVASDARDALAGRMQSGLPPDTFQANIGADLFNWVLFNGRDAEDSKIESLTDMALALEWEGAFPAELMDAVSYDGDIYGVPLNVHRINSLFYRKDLFEKYGLSPPGTVSELNELCQMIASNTEIQAEAAGGMACLGLGNKSSWPLAMFTFEMLLPAMAGAEYYVRYFDGDEDPDSEQMRAVLDEVLLLACAGNVASCEKSWFSANRETAEWDQGVKELAQKTAMMTAMGDWAKGYLESEAGGRLVPDEQFGVVPFPGSVGTFVFTADTFGLPKGAVHRDGARGLLRTMASKDGQIAFNRLKGSIPARSDIAPADFDAMTQRTMDDFQTGTRVKALSGILPRDAMSNMQSELRASLREGSTSIIRRYLVHHYEVLR